MRYVIKQRLLSLTESFFVRDEAGDKVYQVQGKLLSIGDKLTMKDMHGQTVATIREEVLSLTPSYRIRQNGGVVAEINKKLLSVFRDRFRVQMKDGTPDLRVEGNFLDHNYTFKRVGGEEIATVSKAWVALRDSYGVDIEPDANPVLILACAIIIDMVSHDANSADPAT
jgi:uncharacterized protein YxjI